MGCSSGSTVIAVSDSVWLSALLEFFSDSLSCSSQTVCCIKILHHGVMQLARRKEKYADAIQHWNNDVYIGGVHHMTPDATACIVDRGIF